jgi:DNA-binding NarL/FixJ family response regulator
MPIERKIRLLLADDHEMVRCGVKSLLAGTEIEIVAEAATGQAASKLALEEEVDLVLLDVCMPDGDGLTALGCIKLNKPDLPVLLYSAFDNPASVTRAASLGASGFLLKDCTRDELLKGIRIVASGRSVWNRYKLRSLRKSRVGTLEASLSEREGEVLRRIASGLSNEQIAEAMNVGCEAVKYHVKQILTKLDLSDRTQAALWAVRNGLV